MGLVLLTKMLNAKFSNIKYLNVLIRHEPLFLFLCRILNDY